MKHDTARDLAAKKAVDNIRRREMRRRQSQQISRSRSFERWVEEARATGGFSRDITHPCTHEAAAHVAFEASEYMRDRTTGRARGVWSRRRGIAGDEWIRPLLLDVPPVLTAEARAKIATLDQGRRRECQ